MAHETTKADLDRRSKVRAVNAHGQGMGRHTRDEVYAMARGDMTALSDFIGNYYDKKHRGGTIRATILS